MNPFLCKEKRFIPKTLFNEKEKVRENPGRPIKMARRKKRRRFLQLVPLFAIMAAKVLTGFLPGNPPPNPPIGLPVRKVEYSKSVSGDEPSVIQSKQLAPKISTKKQAVFQPQVNEPNVGLAYGLNPIYTRNESELAGYKDFDSAKLNRFLQSWSDYVNYLHERGSTHERALQTLQYNQQFQSLTPEEREKIIEEVSGEYAEGEPAKSKERKPSAPKPEGRESTAYPLGYYFELPSHIPLEKYKELVERNSELLAQGRLAYLHPSGEIREGDLRRVFRNNPEMFRASLPPQVRRNLQQLFNEACTGLRSAGYEPGQVGVERGDINPNNVPFYEHILNGRIRNLIFVPNHADKEKQDYYESFYNPQHDAFRWNALAHLLSTATPHPLEEYERE